MKFKHIPMKPGQRIQQCKFDKGDGHCHAMACYDSETKCKARFKNGQPNYAVKIKK